MKWKAALPKIFLLLATALAPNWETSTLIQRLDPGEVRASKPALFFADASRAPTVAEHFKSASSKTHHQEFLALEVNPETAFRNSYERLTSRELLKIRPSIPFAHAARAPPVSPRCTSS